MKKPTLDDTNAEIDTLSTIQIKRLLLLASAAEDLLEEPDSPVNLERSLSEFATPSGETGDQLLQRAIAPTTSIRNLNDIKGFAKKFVSDTDDLFKAESAKILYHIAVAAAYGREGLEISSRSLSDRIYTYSRLAAIFQNSSIGDVFLNAIRRAQKKEFPNPPVKSQSST